MRYQKHGHALAEQGYDTTPLNGKVPVLKGWQHRPDAAKDFAKYAACNIGIVLGGVHHLIAADIDVRDAEAAAEIKALAIDILGAAPERIGAAPKTMLIYRANAATTKRKTAVYDVDGKDACVEILAEGQQFVASGIHPDTKEKYKWPSDSLMDYPASELPLVNGDDISEFLAAANTVLGNYGVIKSKSLVNSSVSGGRGLDFSSHPQQAEYERVFAAMAHVSNDDMHYDDWTYIAHAIKGALGDNVPALDVLHQFSEKSSKYDAGETDRLWKSIGEVKSIGAGTIFHHAAQGGYVVHEDNFGPDDLVIEHCPSKAALAADGSFWAHSVHAPIAPREWVIEDWVPRKTVTMLFGAGGVGKTLLAQQLANCVAAGETLFGIKTQQMPVISVSCEDDKDELSRRQLDINQWMGINEFGSGPDNLLLWPRVGHDNILVTFPGQGEDQAGKFFEILCDKIEAVKGDADHILVILDTAADLFGGSEIARREVNTFVKTYLGSIVQKYNATVILLAHPSLSGLASGSGMSGSTAWENSVRSRSYLHSDDDDNSIRTLSRMKSNYSSIGADNDIKLIWDEGVLCVPTTAAHFDKINNVELKHAVMAEVDIAWYAKNPFRSQGARGYKTALVAALKQHKKGAVVGAFNDLVGGGNIVHEERKGFRTEKSL